jgi:enamine deaminase RidA (YjgF/YER057c/UK114 family)
LFTSGLTSDRPGGLESETHRVFQLILAMLREARVSPDDVVRTRAWYVDDGGEAVVREAHGVVFDHPGPAFSAVRASCLPDNAAVAIELEAIRGAAGRVKRFGFNVDDSTSLAVFLDGELWLSGVTAPGRTTAAQVTGIVNTATKVLEEFSLTAADVVATRHFMRHDTQSEDRSNAWPQFMKQAIPTSAGIAVEAVGDGRRFMLECEAVADAGPRKKSLRSGRSFEVEHNYCRSVRVQGRGLTYVAGSTSIVPGEIVRHPGDVSGQVADTLETVRWAIEEQGMKWSDLVRTRTYVVGGAEKLMEAAAALETALGGMETTRALIGVPVLGRPEVVVEIEATAVEG